MTIGEAIRLERKAKGWSQDEAGREIAMQTATLSCYAMEWLEGRVDVGDVPSIALYAMARLDMHPLKRMVEAERAEGRAAMLSHNADWRLDPKRAAEAVTGGRWVTVNGFSDIGPPAPSGIALSEVAPPFAGPWWNDCWWYVAIDDDGVVDGPESGDAGILAASVALVEAIISGTLTLPPECPGIAALEGWP